MKLLFLSLSAPFPPTNGQRLRNWAILNALAREGHQVTLISFADPGESAPPRELKQLCHAVEFVPLRLAPRGALSDYAERLRSLPALLPHGVRRFHSAEFRAVAEAWVAREQFDAILCDDVYMIRNLPRKCEAPVMLNKHDLTYVILARYLKLARNPAHLAYGWLEYWKLRKWEIDACRNIGLVLTCSKVDRDLLQERCPSSRFAIVPNALPPTDYTIGPEETANTLLYFGSLDFLPNQDAIHYLLSQIFPAIRRAAPETQLIIAGRNAPDDLRRRIAEAPGVQFLGSVDDMRPVIARATVCVVPLRIGSGTRLKILEAAVMGKPIVSTRIGAEGLDLADGTEILLADDPQAFAQAAIDLLGNQRRRGLMGRAASRRVRQEYGAEALQRAVGDALLKFLPVAVAAQSHSGVC